MMCWQWRGVCRTHAASTIVKGKDFISVKMKMHLIKFALISDDMQTTYLQNSARQHFCRLEGVQTIVRVLKNLSLVVYSYAVRE